MSTVMKIESGRGVLSMDNTDKLVDLLIDIKKEFCKKYYNGSDCQQFDSHNNLHWCPMAYYGKGSFRHTASPEFCQISDIINTITERGVTIDD